MNMLADLMSEREHDRLTKMEGATVAAWEYYQRWLKRHREANPEDERGDLELVGVFSAQVNSRRIERN